MSKNSKRGPAATITPTQALTAIQALMRGREWNSDTTAEIAIVMRDAGFLIEEPTPDYHIGASVS